LTFDKAKTNAGLALFPSLSYINIQTAGRAYCGDIIFVYSLCRIYTVSQKTSRMFLAITRESIVGFS